jgi:hypothetical protein
MGQHTPKHLCFQLWLVYISSLNPLCKADVMQFWSTKDFPYCLWLSDDQIIIRNWNWHFKMEAGHIWILLALMDKKFQTFTICSICFACYSNSYCFNLKIVVFKFVDSLKVNKFSVPYMIWCRNINL